MGDVHGDYRVFSQLLHHLNLTTEIGGEIELKNDLLFIQTGDVLDRGPDGLKILKILMKAMDKYHERVDFLLGNHELMNLYGNFYYVHQDEYSSEYKNLLLDDQSPIRKFLLERNIVRLVDGVIYTHAGLVSFFIENDPTLMQNIQNPSMVVKLLNEKAVHLLKHGTRGFHTRSPKSLLGPKGPFWTRDLSDNEDCEALYAILDLLNANHMVVGHTIKDEVTILCHDKKRKKSLICIDTGMSSEYGGLPYAIKIVDGKTLYIYNSKTNETTMIDLETNEMFELLLQSHHTGSHDGTIRMIIMTCVVALLILACLFLATQKSKEAMDMSSQIGSTPSPSMISSPPTIQFKLDNEKKIQGSRKSIRYDFINPQHYENGHLRKTL
ncbi:hypothetical protein C9374_012576 [Naegleria lovaniensis]|uniref:Calcineurin-like phosphoesterase domain-containing protein n=1 Tax=Naegleria lovaniensis TaxID=51637 RepID=A0AA88GXE7_NAELO|nr:uncharacterized protein C9374_012576 [Naegleria lovaniensis]KAG2392324.1 hypothetical protein C9374_012576 [Naegleria lovaniensis]